MAKAKRRIKIGFSQRIGLDNIYGRDYAYQSIGPSVSIEDEAEDGESERDLVKRLMVDCEAIFLEVMDQHLAMSKRVIDDGSAGVRRRRNERREARKKSIRQSSSSSKGVPW